MTSRFNQLKKTNYNLYQLGLSIERQINTSPSAIFSEGTTFIEGLLKEIYNKEGMEYQRKVPFYVKVQVLFDKNIISKPFYRFLKQAYKARNRIHNEFNSPKQYFDENKKQAFRLYELLVKCSQCYNDYLINKFQLKEHQQSKRKERNLKINEKCIICQRKVENNSYLCPHCYKQKDFLVHLKIFLSYFNYNTLFLKEHIIKLGYTSKEAENIIEYCIENELIYPYYGGYVFHENNTKNFIEKVSLYSEVENLFSRYQSNRITYTQLLNFDSFQKGKNNIEPFVNFYNEIYNNVLNNILKKFQSNKKISNIVKPVNFPSEELVKLFESGKYDSINEKMKTLYLRYVENNLNKKSIIKNLSLNDEVYPIVLKTIIQQLQEDFYNSLEDEKTIEAALSSNNLNKSYLNEFLKDYDFRQKFNKIIGKRKKIFLKTFKKEGLLKAFDQSHLTIDDLETINKNDMFFKLINDILKDKYYENNDFDEELLNFFDFKKNEDKNKIIKIKLLLISNAFDNFINLEKIMKSLKLTFNDINCILIECYFGRKYYDELLKKFRENIFPNLFNNFLKLFKNNSLDCSLKQANIDPIIMKFECDLNSNIKKHYLKAKKDKFIKYSVEKSSKSAFDESNLTLAEYNECFNELNNNIINLKMHNVIENLKINPDLCKAIKNYQISIDDVYFWYNEGIKGKKEFKKFSKEFKNLYLNRLINFILNQKDKYKITLNNVYMFLEYKNMIKEEERKCLEKYNILEDI